MSTYSGQLNDDLGCGVTIETYADATFDPRALSALPQTVLAPFKSAGAHDAAVTDQARITVDGHPGIDFRLSFIADGGEHVRWWYRVVDQGHSELLLQTFSSDQSAPASELLQLQHHLTGTLELAS